MQEPELSRALSYFYDFPQDLPFRACGAHGRAAGPVPKILVSFDEDIFTRKRRVRPLSEDDLESVDPFAVDAGRWR